MKSRSVLFQSSQPLSSNIICKTDLNSTSNPPTPDPVPEPPHHHRQSLNMSITVYTHTHTQCFSTCCVYHSLSACFCFLYRSQGCEVNFVLLLWQGDRSGLQTDGQMDSDSSATEPRCCFVCRMWFDAVLLKWSGSLLKNTSSGWQHMFSFNGALTDVQVTNTVAPEGPKTTTFQYWFSALCRLFSAALHNCSVSVAVSVKHVTALNSKIYIFFEKTITFLSLNVWNVSSTISCYSGVEWFSVCRNSSTFILQLIRVWMKPDVVRNVLKFKTLSEEEEEEEEEECSEWWEKVQWRRESSDWLFPPGSAL